MNNTDTKTLPKTKGGRAKTGSGHQKKNFILDTNVILHDYKCLDNFEENDIYIPFVVLEELDKFKKGSDQINYNARAFIRELDEITDDTLSNKLIIYTSKAGGCPFTSVKLALRCLNT